MYKMWMNSAGQNSDERHVCTIRCFGFVCAAYSVLCDFWSYGHYTSKAVWWNECSTHKSTKMSCTSLPLCMSVFLLVVSTPIPSVCLRIFCYHRLYTYDSELKMYSPCIDLCMCSNEWLGCFSFRWWNYARTDFCNNFLSSGSPPLSQR